MAAKFVFVAFVLAFCSAAHPVGKKRSTTTTVAPVESVINFVLLLSKLQKLEQKLSKIEQTMDKQAKNIFRSCSEEPSKLSGKYRLQPNANEQPFVGFCEQENHGGGWLVIQHRFDGSVNFYRDWTEYRNGFGKIDGEFWIGLEKLHKLTKNKHITLLVEMEDYDGNYGYSRYNSFEIGNETEKYVLKSLGEHTGGSIKGSMRINEGQMFTTRDSDNDKSEGNCAQEQAGAWWYAACGNTNPNGPFHKQEAKKKKIYWYAHRNGVELKFFRMMIKNYLQDSISSQGTSTHGVPTVIILILIFYFLKGV